MQAASKNEFEPDRTEAENSPPPVAAAKLHVLQLEPIKARIGDRWERLSNLVHRLFEKALKNKQGPRDHFVLAGELSYIVTFHDLTPEEASIACASIARNVCELLFGNGADGISVRSLVGSVAPSAIGPAMAWQRLGDYLEQTGKETLITGDSLAKTAGGASRRAGAPPPEWLPGIALALVPMWQLDNRVSRSFFLAPQVRADRALSVRRALCGATDTEAVQSELALLHRAAEYGLKFRASGQMWAAGAGVSYETLSGFHSRIRYITALKNITASPFLLKIEDVPPGLSLARLGEMIAMLQQKNLRILVEFASVDLPGDLDIRLGAAGIGATIPDICSVNSMRAIGKLLSQQAARQKAFAFVNGLDSDALLEAAAEHVRFGFGAAVTGNLYSSGEEGLVPKSPASPAFTPHPAITHT